MSNVGRSRSSSGGVFGGLRAFLGAAVDRLPWRDRSRRLAAMEAAAEERGRLLERVAEAEAFKSRLLAELAHDVRGPAAGLVVVLERLEEEAASGEAARLAGTGRTAAAGLLRLVEDVLMLARLDRESESHPPCTWFDPVEVLREAAETARAQPEADGLVVTVDAPPSGAMVLGDAEGVRRILVNLGVNAVKFTADGRVTFELRVASTADPGRIRLCFAVRDTGPGIPDERRADVFADWGRLGAAPGLDGAGLGLAIAARLARRMSARLDLESEVGRGSVFRLEVTVGDAEIVNEIFETQGLWDD